MGFGLVTLFALPLFTNNGQFVAYLHRHFFKVVFNGVLERGVQALLVFFSYPKAPKHFSKIFRSVVNDTNFVVNDLFFVVNNKMPLP